MSADRPGEPEPGVLRSAIDESRTVLDHQIDLVAKMDDIAMHTLRTSVVVIGIIVSAAGLAGPTAIAELSAFGVGLITFGLACLFATVLLDSRPCPRHRFRSGYQSPIDAFSFGTGSAVASGMRCS